MAKKIKWKYWLKLTGIAAACAVGFLGLVVAYVAITGGFKQKFVEIEQIAFNKNVDNFYGTDSNGDPVFVITEDGYFKILPTPEDATELYATIKITSGSSLVEDVLVLKTEEDENQNIEDEIEPVDEDENLPTSDEDDGYVSATKVEGKNNTYNIRINEDFKIKLKENHHEILDRVITFYVEHLTDYCKASVIVDVPVESFELTYEKINAVAGSENVFFPGDQLYVYVDASKLLPSTSLLQSSLTDLTDKYKYITFEINDEASDIARIERVVVDQDKTLKALITILNPGDFTVTAALCKTYTDESKILSEEQIELLTMEEKEAYNNMLYGKEANAETGEEEIVGILATSNIKLHVQHIEIGSISAIKDILTYRLFSSDILDVAELGLSINPVNIPGSCYTSDDLKYLLSEVEIKGGYFVESENAADVVYEYIENGQTKYKYIKLTDRYIKVDKQFDAQNNPIWSIVILDYKSTIEPTNCLYIEYVYEVQVDEENTKEEKINNYIPLTITRDEVPSFKIDLHDNDGQSINLIVSDNEQTQDIYDMSQNQLVLINEDGSLVYPKTFLKDSSSSYKTVLYVTEDSNGNLTFENDLITVTNAVLSTPELLLTNQIIPNKSGNVGTTYVYAIVVKTDINGNIVDSENMPIETLTDLSKCVILYKTQTQHSIRVNIYRPLEISAQQPILVYDNEFNLIEDFDDNELFDFQTQTVTLWDETLQDYVEIETVTAITMYIDTSVYIKVNYNNVESFKNAYDNGEFSYTLDGDIASVGSLVKHEDDYYIELMANKVDAQNLSDNLSFKLKESTIYNLRVTTRDYILQKITLSTNATDSEDAQVYLNFDETLESGFAWTVNKLENTPIVISSAIQPVQAIVGTIQYKIFDYQQFMDLLNIESDISKWQELPRESTSVVEFEGTPSYDEDDKVENLNLTVHTAGKVVILAYYELDAHTTIYSNYIVVETLFPNGLMLQEDFKYSDDSVEIINGEEFDVINSSYNGQKTDLLKHIGGLNNGASKMQIIYEQSESMFEPINNKLYKFVITSNNVQAEIVYDDNASTYYMITPLINETKLITVKVMTTFGFDTGKTYNYKFVSDIVTSINENYVNGNASYNGYNKRIEMTYADTVELFKFKHENNSLISTGLLNVTNSNKSSYRIGVQDKVTGSTNGTKVTIIYLPNNLNKNDLNGLIENFDSTKLAEQNGHILYDAGNNNIYEFKFELLASYQSGDITINKCTLSTNIVDESKDSYIDFSYIIYYEDGSTYNVGSFGIKIN